ncbi:MAG TPA: hypothetical protein VKR78_01555, partial [Acidimicrobiales bacterium]|nr:hypothetical protein [Acidimicrobiales bacterium]
QTEERGVSELLGGRAGQANGDRRENGDGRGREERSRGSARSSGSRGSSGSSGDGRAPERGERDQPSAVEEGDEGPGLLERITERARFTQ